MKVKIIGLLAALATVAVLAIVASGATGAFFSDSHSGTITGTVGSILISPAGYNSDGSSANGTDIHFANLLPGEPQTVKINYQNTGNNPEDVWIVFPNADALHALNDLGTYGSVSIGDVGGGVNWVSNNLTDFYPSGTPGSIRPPATVADPTLYHVPSQMLLESNLAPNATGQMTFTFAYASKLTGPGGGAWNAYPVSADTHGGETYVPVSATPGSGLPYKIVATQVGQDPGALVHPPLSPAPAWY